MPAGYRAREFRDSDREPWVEERNAQVHELQRSTAEEWREWERIDPPKDRIRMSVDAADGRLAAGAELGPGFFPRADGTLFGGVNVMRAHRRKGLGTAVLGVVESEARAAKAPRILGSTNVAFEGALEWALARGYREIGRRIESYVEVNAFDGRPFADVVRRVETSGLRLATVSTVALVTVGVLVGHGGLGQLILAGFRVGYRAEITTGTVLCVVLALLLDLFLAGAGRLLTPWSRRAR